MPSAAQDSPTACDPMAAPLQLCPGGGGSSGGLSSWLDIPSGQGQLASGLKGSKSSLRNSKPITKVDMGGRWQGWAHSEGQSMHQGRLPLCCSYCLKVHILT